MFYFDVDMFKSLKSKLIINDFFKQKLAANSVKMYNGVITFFHILFINNDEIFCDFVFHKQKLTCVL